MNQFEAWIARQRRRLSLGVFLTAFADATAVFLLVFGSSVLLVKLARPGTWPGVLWLAVLGIPLTFGLGGTAEGEFFHDDRPSPCSTPGPARMAC